MNYTEQRIINHFADCNAILYHSTNWNNMPCQHSTRHIYWLPLLNWTCKLYEEILQQDSHTSSYNTKRHQEIWRHVKIWNYKKIKGFCLCKLNNSHYPLKYYIFIFFWDEQSHSIIIFFTVCITFLGLRFIVHHEKLLRPPTWL